LPLEYGAFIFTDRDKTTISFLVGAVGNSETSFGERYGFSLIRSVILLAKISQMDEVSFK
jgi:hypothetical protein